MKRRSFIGSALAVSAVPILGLTAKADRPVTLEDPVEIIGWGYKEEVVPFNVATFIPIVFKELSSEIEYITKDGVKLIFRLGDIIHEWPMDPDPDPRVFVSEWKKLGSYNGYDTYNVKSDVEFRLRCQKRDKGKYIFENMGISENVNYEFFEIIYETPVNKNYTSYVYRTLWHRAYEVKR